MPLFDAPEQAYPSRPATKRTKNAAIDVDSGICLHYVDYCGFNSVMRPVPVLTSTSSST